MASLVLRIGRRKRTSVPFTGMEPRGRFGCGSENESCAGHTTRQLTRDVHSAISYIDLSTAGEETWKYMNKFVSHKQMIDN